MAKVAVLGHGTVGSGVAEILFEKVDLLSQRAGEAVELGYILNIVPPPALAYQDRFVTDYEKILADNEVMVVAEAIGGIHPAYDFAKSAILAGKHVVTSNKELVAEKGAELLALAKQHNVNFLFEASVGAGIPLIHPIHECLSANYIQRIAGILNGTSNFILTKMVRQGAAFEQVLKEAQELGYAEADPSADVDGLDTGRKICILASLAFGRQIYPKDVSMFGIRDVTAAEVTAAEQLGYAIKLVGYAQPIGEHVEIFVAPMLIPHTNLLAGVNDVFNGVEIVGDAVDKLFFVGRGAGKDATASGVVGDIVDCIRAKGNIASLTWADTTTTPALPFTKIKMVQMVTYQGKQTEVEAAFPAAQILQTSPQITFLTPRLSMQDVEEAIQTLRTTGTVVSHRIVLPD